MPLDNSRHRRVTRAALGCMLGAVLLVAGGVGHALAGDDDEDELPDVKLLRGFIHGLGLKGPNDEGIDYRERSPLVVPPNRDLPPPQTDATVKNPDWPVDADVKKRKEASRKEKNRGPYNFMEESRPLRPDELRKGRAVTNRGAAPGGAHGEGQQMSPTELGFKDSIFSLSTWKSVFGSNEPETAPFTGEPTRESLTEPPPGYQTPSPDQPYGVGVAKTDTKAPTLYDRAEGNAGK